MRVFWDQMWTVLMDFPKLIWIGLAIQMEGGLIHQPSTDLTSTEPNLARAAPERG